MYAHINTSCHTPSTAPALRTQTRGWHPTAPSYTRDHLCSYFSIARCVSEAEILKSELATQLTIYNDYRADFSEFLPRWLVLVSRATSMWHKFSKDSSLLSLPHAMIIELNFENFCYDRLRLCCVLHKQGRNSQKSARYPIYYMHWLQSRILRISAAITCARVACCTSVADILKRELAGQFTICNDYRSDFSEFLLRSFALVSRATWARHKFSKVSSLPNLPYALTIDLTFENFRCDRLRLCRALHEQGRNSQKAAHCRIFYTRWLWSWIIRIFVAIACTRVARCISEAEILKSELAARCTTGWLRLVGSMYL